MHPRATGGVLTEIVAAGGRRERTDGRGARRITIGFQGGQVLALRVSDDAAARR